MKDHPLICTVSELRALRDAREEWITSKIGPKGGCYNPDEMPEELRAYGNDETSALEVYEWLTSPPDRKFCYIDADQSPATATTWTGDVLGRVMMGAAWRDNFGGVRVPVTVHGINGKRYFGTYFQSSGDYARLRLAKGQ